MKRFFLIGMLGLLLAPAHGQPAQKTWVTGGAYSEMHIVIPATPSETMQNAARLFQQNWQAATGHKPEISALNQGMINIWLGPEVLTPDLLNPSELEDLGPEGFLIRTYTPPPRAMKLGAQKQLILTGATEQGTLNAVYEFFSRFMGASWLAPGLVVPKPGNYRFPAIDHRFVPTFSTRELGYNSLWPESGRAYRLAHHFKNEVLPGPWGGHTFYALLPPDRYFDKHPEYYAEINGRRVAVRGEWQSPARENASRDPRGQLCCSNPATAKAVLEELITLINAGEDTADTALRTRRNALRPFSDPKIWSVSQMDWLGPCQCPLCREIDVREESAMGSLLTLVNRVAEGLETALPGAGHKVHTFAQAYSRRPPKTLRPRDNVIVELCNDACDFSRPLDDPQSAVNAAFIEDLAAWSLITEHLHIRDFVANAISGQQPHPNLEVLQPNIQCYDQYNVEGVFAQPMELPGWPFAEMDTLRAYLLSEFLWDPDMPYSIALDNFLGPNYGPAAPKIHACISLLNTFVRDKGVHLSCYAPPYWWNYDLITAAENLFQEALAEPLTEPQRANVLRAHLPVQYAALVCPPRIRAEEDRLVFERPPSLALEEYLAAIAQSAGTITERPVRDPVPEIKQVCGESTPPRREEHPFVVLENERYLAWIAPELQGAILRWRDKQLDIELLRGFQYFGSRAGLWQEWTAEGSVTAEYTVVEKDSQHLVLRAVLDNGLVLTRELRLTPGSDRLIYALAIHNPGQTPIPASLYVRPEFFSQGALAPEIWAQENSAWTRLLGNQGYPGAFEDGLERPADGITRWAFHASGVSVIQDFTEQTAGQLRFYYAALEPGQCVRLEQLLPPTPLAPGETRRIESGYWTSKSRPDAL